LDEAIAEVAMVHGRVSAFYNKANWPLGGINMIYKNNLTKGLTWGDG